MSCFWDFDACQTIRSVTTFPVVILLEIQHSITKWQGAMWLHWQREGWTVKLQYIMHHIISQLCTYSWDQPQVCGWVWSKGVSTVMSPIPKRSHIKDQCTHCMKSIKNYWVCPFCGVDLNNICLMYFVSWTESNFDSAVGSCYSPCCRSSSNIFVLKRHAEVLLV